MVFFLADEWQQLWEDFWREAVQPDLLHYGLYKHGAIDDYTSD